jgi:gliding motility-associated-like protein
MRRYLLLLLLLLILPFGRIFATHNVAGEITYRAIDPTCHDYEVTVTTYTDMRSSADRCSLQVFFGDGTNAWVNRSVVPAEDDTGLGLCTAPQGNGMPLQLIGYPQYQYFKKNIYRVNHSYPGSGTYIISMKDPNRVAGICNILNSVNIQFYLQSVLVINDFLGCNQYSPQLSTVPLDMACVNHCFYHNPGAFDPEGDSLSYSLSPCYDTTQAPLAQWSPLPLTAGGSLSIDPVSGLMSWCSPPDICSYNICIRITKWRKWFGNWYNMGYVQRDMQILVSTCNNDNPVLNQPKDTCVIAGTHLHFIMTGSDPIRANGLHMSAYGDVFHVTPPIATFPIAPDAAICSCYFGSNPISSPFDWQTTCDHIRSSPHQVTFRLENNNALAGSGSQPVDLLDFATVNITVIAPAPQPVHARPFGQTMHLHWKEEFCNPTGNGFLNYEIYRRQGCDTLNPGPCTTGVPALWGYSLIGTTLVGQITDTTFIDNNGGAGLVPGVTYSYRIVALYSDGAQSQPSKNTCANLKQDIPVITNVDVDSTSATAGVIFVKWKNATADSTTGLDTVAFPGPYTLKIYRSNGFVMAHPSASPIRIISNAFLYSMPDSIIDRTPVLNTQDSAWSYRIDFFYFNTSASTYVLVGSTQRASSVYLHLTPSDHKLTLTWQDTVPWTNYQYKVYKQAATSPYIWNYIGSTTQRSYADSNLINHHNYCYYITTYGSYFNAALPDTLLNRSQRTCLAPYDNIPPCPPILSLNSDCENFMNTLTWSDPNHSCADDVVTYNIWYSPNTTDPMTIIQTVTFSSDTVLVLTDLASVAGCYAVSALDSFSINQSIKSNIVCADNCPFYALPNVFTPNGDNHNDFYDALPYRYVESVDMNIYDRWGVLLFHTTDPHIHWDGKAMQTGAVCTDGVYYYVCTVNSKRLSGNVPFVLKGFIQLIASPDANH